MGQSGHKHCTARTNGVAQGKQAAIRIDLKRESSAVCPFHERPPIHNRLG